MSIRIRNLLPALLLGIAVSALADTSPTLAEVYQAARSGHLNQAEQMMVTVLQQHPDSAKAHYVDAEILAREGKLDQARTELATARQYDSGLSFATPRSVNELEKQLSGQSGAMATAPARHESRFPWGLFFVGIGSILGIFWLVRMLTARQRAVPAPGPYYSGYPGNGFQPGGYPGAPYGGGPMMPGGGGIMGGGGIGSSLVTGAAVGAGMVAGEALAHNLMDGGRASAGEIGQQDAWAAPVNSDMGGNDFGINDGGSWDSGGDFGGGDSGGDWT